MPAREFRPYTRPKSRHVRRSWWARLLDAVTRETGIAWWRGWFSSERRSTVPDSRPARAASGVTSRGQAAALEVTELNRRLLGYTVSIALLSGVGLFAGHYYQQRRLADWIPRHADELASAGEWMRAAEWRWFEVKSWPHDAAARLRLAETYDRAARGPRQQALLAKFYEDALTLGSESAEVRRRLGELWLKLDRPQRALDHAAAVLEADPEDALGWRIRAQAFDQLAKVGQTVSPADAADALRQALESNPGDIELASELAALYRTRLAEPSPQERIDMADAVMDRLVQVNPNLSASYMARYAYRKRFGIVDADSDLQRALDLGENNVEALLAAGSRALERSQIERAVEFYERAVSVAPQNREGYLGLGRARERDGQIEAAIEAWQRGLTVVGPQESVLGLELARTLVRLGRREQAEKTLRQLDAGIDATAWTLQTEERQHLMRDRDDAWAQWHLSAGEYREAIPLLRQVLLVEQGRLDVTGTAEGRLEVHRQLAACHVALGQPDLAASEFEAMVELQPTVAEHRLAAARTWMQSGRIEATMTHAEATVALPEVPEEAWVLLTRAHLVRQLRLPPVERDWAEFLRRLQQSKQFVIQADLAASLCLCEVDYLQSIDQAEAALELLDTAVAAYPSSRLLLEAMIVAQEKWGRRTEVDRWLERFELQVPDPREVALLRAWVMCLRTQYDTAIGILNNLLSFVEPERQVAIERDMALIRWQAGPFTDAREALTELARTYPGDPQSVLALAEFCFDCGNVREAEHDEDLLYEVERSSGTLWRYVRARHQLLRLGSIEEMTLAESGQLQKRIEITRPSWSLNHFLRGLVARRRGQLAEAVSALKESLDMGQAGLRAVEPLMGVLHEEGFDREADRYLARLDDNSLVRDMPNQAIDVTRRYGDGERAIRLARESLGKDPGNPVRIVRLGRALADVRLLAEAEQMLRRAVQLAPEDPATWLALTRFYASTGQTYIGRLTLDEFAANNEIDVVMRAATLGRCYEMINEFDKAADAHLGAAQRAASDSAVLRRAAAFMMLRDPKTADKLLRRMITLDPQALTPRRWLARLLARAGDEASVRESFELLTDAQVSASVSPFDLLLTARAFAGFGTAGERRVALALLNHLETRPGGLARPERFLLAQLQFDEGLLSQAHDELESLLGSAEATSPPELALLVEVLLAENQLPEAERRLTQLTEIDPDRLRRLRLTARLQKARDPSVNVEQLIDQGLEGAVEAEPDRYAKVALLTEMADLYSQLGYPAASERCLRQVLELDPPSYPALVSLLTSQDRAGDAIDLCLRVASSDDSVQPCLVIASILSTGRVDQEQLRRAAPLLASASERFPRHSGVLFGIGLLRALDGNDGAATGFLRRVTALQPDHVPARKYLALLLSASQESVDEARLLIDQAIALAGPQPELREVQAVVRLRQSDVAGALATLEELTAAPKATALQWYHLAQARQQAGQRDAARQALKQAQEAGLSPQRLSPFDQKQLVQLQQQLAA